MLQITMLRLLAILVPSLSLPCVAKPYVRHESNVCMLRGQCGKLSFFGPELPCPFNEPAVQPEDKFRTALIRLCGERYSDGPVCCDSKQLESLQDSLKKAENLIASCPACRFNFVNFFCSFTCSPDQSLFLEIEETVDLPSGQSVVTELSHYVSETSARGFFDSCKSVKFSATNGYVMDLIGGGAKNSSSFLRFLGQKSLLGSPIQINYPDNIPSAIVPMDNPTLPCNTENQNLKCACVDCPDACPTLPMVPDPRHKCSIGLLPCFTFWVLLTYLLSMTGFVIGYIMYLRHFNQKQRPAARLLLGLRSGNNLDDGDQGDLNLGPEEDRHETYVVNSWLQHFCSRIGRKCAHYPYAVIGMCCLLVAVVSIGWLNFEIETSPAKLWVAPDSNAAIEKVHFDDTFGPFYRTQQLFLINDTVSESTVVTYENLKWWFTLEDQIKDLDANGTSLSDICLNPTGDGCVIQSITGYWQGDFTNLDGRNWKAELEDCILQPVNCLPLFQQPLQPRLILGGYTDNYIESKALVSSIVLPNSLNQSTVARAANWERSLKVLLLEAQQEARTRGLRLTFSTESSLEEELNKSTNTDANIVLASYLVMFLYVSLALGNTRAKGARVFIESKFSLGLFGVLIVLLSISAAVGLFSIFGLKITLIIAEVIPFLVLAVGVDNIFLLTHEFHRVCERYNELSIDERMAMTLGRMGPSVLLSASCETAAFALGAAVSMPAVRNFAVYAAGAVAINAALQLTMFPAAMALDQKRVETNRIDCVPCLRIANDPVLDFDGEGSITRIIRKRYVPYILRPGVKRGIFFLFLTATISSLALLPWMPLGLDQKMAVPHDSYLVGYFEDLSRYLGIGPPVYYVVRGANATDRQTQTALCGRFTSCHEFSMANILEQERKRPNISYMIEPAASWLDDFFYWLNPTLDMCCRSRINDSHTLCHSEDSDRFCEPCFAERSPPWNITLDGMPIGTEFLLYAQAWLDSPTNENCPLAGKASFSDAVVLDLEHTSLAASHARSFHTPLRTQDDLIESYAAARRIAADISIKTGLDVYPYAVHYIFFDQYATIRRLSLTLVSCALFLVFLISAIFLGSPKSALLTTITATMIVVDVAGSMVLFSIRLNALSLVNLIICVGIGVEFCSHFARAYMFPSSKVMIANQAVSHEREWRVHHALINVGPSIFTGITICKFMGVSVLAFTRSKIFEVYYFRMWLALVFIAAAHGLIFLPILFSYFGPEGYTSQELDPEIETNEWVSNAGGRYNDSLLSFHDDDESYNE